MCFLSMLLLLAEGIVLFLACMPLLFFGRLPLKSDFRHEPGSFASAIVDDAMMTQKRARDASRGYFGPRLNRLDHVINEMCEEKRQKQDSDADHPKEKMLGQFGGVDFLLIHEGEDTPHGRTGGSTPRAFTTKGTIRSLRRS